MRKETKMPIETILQEGEQAATTLSTVVTAEMMSGVFDQIVALLPVCIPVMVSFIALRKGIGFVKSVLHSA